MKAVPCVMYHSSQQTSTIYKTTVAAVYVLHSSFSFVYCQSALCSLCILPNSIGVFTFVSKKEVKPAPVPFDLAASLKRTPKSYTPYKGKETGLSVIVRNYIGVAKLDVYT